MCEQLHLLWWYVQLFHCDTSAIMALLVQHAANITAQAGSRRELWQSLILDGTIWCKKHVWSPLAGWVLCFSIRLYSRLLFCNFSFRWWLAVLLWRCLTSSCNSFTSNDDWHQTSGPSQIPHFPLSLHQGGKKGTQIATEAPSSSPHKEATDLPFSFFQTRKSKS